MSKTILLSDYLKTDNGQKALSIYSTHVADLGRQTAENSGWNYSLAYALRTLLMEKVPNSPRWDFALLPQIVDASPESVANNWICWEDGECAGNILGTDEDARLIELHYAFDIWSLDTNGEWIQEGIDYDVEEK